MQWLTNNYDWASFKSMSINAHMDNIIRTSTCSTHAALVGLPASCPSQMKPTNETTTNATTFRVVVPNWSTVAAYKDKCACVNGGEGAIGSLI